MKKCMKNFSMTTNSQYCLNHEKIYTCKDIADKNSAMQNHDVDIHKLKNGEYTFMEDIQMLVEATKKGNTELVYRLLKKIVPQYSGEICVGNYNDRQDHGIINTKETVF